MPNDVHVTVTYSTVHAISMQPSGAAACPAMWLATVQALWSAGVITSSRVRDVMTRVDRANYCQGDTPARACYDDNPMRIGWGVTIRCV